MFLTRYKYLKDTPLNICTCSPFKRFKFTVQEGNAPFVKLDNFSYLFTLSTAVRKGSNFFFNFFLVVSVFCLPNLKRSFEPSDGLKINGNGFKYDIR